MVLRESKLVTIDFQAADFSLRDPSGLAYSRDDLMGSKGLVMVFTCNHCPYAEALWGRLKTLFNKIQPNGVNIVAINPNINPNYPSDSPEHMVELIHEKKLPFPYLVDHDQQVARMYEAQCTPDVYLFDAAFNCVYHGRFDDNWKDASAVKSPDLELAVTAMLAGKPVSQTHPSMGCSIKWNE